MKITASTEIANIKDPDDAKRYTSQALTNIAEALNGNISTDNLRCAVKDVTFTGVNSEAQILHNLNVIPIGYIKLSQTAAISVTNSDRGSTDKYIWVRGSAVGTVKLLILG